MHAPRCAPREESRPRACAVPFLLGCALNEFGFNMVLIKCRAVTLTVTGYPLRAGAPDVQQRLVIRAKFCATELPAYCWYSNQGQECDASPAIRVDATALADDLSTGCCSSSVSAVCTARECWWCGAGLRTPGNTSCITNKRHDYHSCAVDTFACRASRLRCRAQVPLQVSRHACAARLALGPRTQGGRGA